jgi:hypothetical protein
MDTITTTALAGEGGRAPSHNGLLALIAEPALAANKDPVISLCRRWHELEREMAAAYSMDEEAGDRLCDEQDTITIKLAKMLPRSITGAQALLDLVLSQGEREFQACYGRFAIVSNVAVFLQVEAEVRS